MSRTFRNRKRSYFQEIKSVIVRYNCYSDEYLNKKLSKYYTDSAHLHKSDLWEFNVRYKRLKRMPVVVSEDCVINLRNN